MISFGVSAHAVNMVTIPSAIHLVTCWLDKILARLLSGTRTTRHAGYAVSQKKRKRVEEIFGWM
jgi:hypothetical protein